MVDVVSTAAFNLFETEPEDRQAALAPEKAPTMMWGQGFPDGDLAPWVNLQKGSIWVEVNADDDDSHIWQKVDEGGDDDDWVRLLPRLWSPLHQGGSYEYGFRIDSDNFFRGTTADKCYMVMIGGDRETGYVATGDSNDAYLRVSGSNYAANDANFILRGINIAVTNRGGGTMGRLENFIGVQNKSTGTVPILHGCTVIAENYGTVSTLGLAMDIISRDENDTSRTYGGVIRLRNDDRSSQSALDSAICVDSHASSGGFDTLIDAVNAELTEYDSGTQVVLMTFQGADGTTYYMVHDTDAATGTDSITIATSVS